MLDRPLNKTSMAYTLSDINYDQEVELQAHPENFEPSYEYYNPNEND